MKKASLLAGAALTALGIAGVVIAPAANAQVASPFADVPMDHWAYSSVEKLRNAGIVIGYPDGTYGGKRPTTRYEFAVAIARLLDKIPAPYVLPEDVVRRNELANFATKDEVAELRRLIEEFRTELTTLGVDLNNVKKRVDALEGRVTAIENELKRVKISGTINLMGRANNRFETTIDTPTGRRSLAGVRDQDGYTVTKVPGKGSWLADARVLHDLDLNIKARLSDTATATAIINFGNYLPFLNSVASYSGSRSDRAAGAAQGLVNQDQQQSIYRLSIDTPLKLFGSVNMNISAGRIPLQLTPYTLKLIDVDQYFYNDKTDLGDIPVDGGKVNLNVGPVAVTGFAGKTDPIKYVSDISGTITGTNGGYGLYAGAAFPSTRNGVGNGSGFRGNAVGTVTDDNVATTSGNRPVQSSIQPNRNGAMSVEQLGGVRLTVGTGKYGTLGGTYMVLAGTPSGAAAPAPFAGAGTGTAAGIAAINADRAFFNRVFLYGGDFNGNFGGLGINASYTKTDTKGDRLNGAGTAILTDDFTKIDEDNYAWDVAASYGFGNLTLGAGYRYIAPYFGAPGYWGRIGAWTNPTDIKGFYANLGYALGGGLALEAKGQFYEGTGDATSFGGLTKDDEITNIRAGLKYGLTSASNIDLGVEYTQYKVIDGFGANVGGRGKPEEWYYNIGYGFNFNPNTSFKFLYQIIDYKDKGTGFDTLNGKGGVAAAQFSVKF
jgi:hypothetical protein